MKLILLLILSSVILSCGETNHGILLDEVFSMERQEVLTKPFKLDSTNIVTLEIKSSEPYPVNIYIISESNIQNFLEVKDFDYFGVFKAKGIHKTKITGKLAAGSYAVAFLLPYNYIPKSERTSTSSKIHYKLSYKK